VHLRHALALVRRLARLARQQPLGSSSQQVTASAAAGLALSLLLLLLLQPNNSD
jgi:hypothetical protein